MMSNAGKSSRWYNVKPRIVQNICIHQNLSSRIKHIPIEGFPPSTPNKSWFHPSCHWVKLYINHSLSGHFLEGSCKFIIAILGCSRQIEGNQTRHYSIGWYIATFERCHTRLTGSNAAFFKHFWLSTCVTNFWLDYIQNQADSRSWSHGFLRNFPSKDLAVKTLAQCVAAKLLHGAMPAPQHRLQGLQRDTRHLVKRLVGEGLRPYLGNMPSGNQTWLAGKLTIYRWLSD